ncbi:MAG: VWA domain-containing protein [Spirochaetes bacterium]|nr:VWA domain-containing protein [Spirochaetota bacterium]
MRKSRGAVPLLALVMVGAAALFAIRLLPWGTGSRPSPAGGNLPQSPPRSAEDGYVLAFDESFVPQLASRDDLGISVVLAVDVSGSMSGSPAGGGSPKYMQAATAFSQVVDVLERLVRDSPKDQVLKVGVLKFNAEATPVMPLTELDATGLRKLRALVRDPDTFYPGGNTAIGGALERSVEWLAQSGTILRSAIIVTDGENTAGIKPSWVLSAVYGNRNSASTEEYPVVTNSTLVSFIGFDVDAGKFTPLEKYGARVTAAADQAQLASVLSNLLEADITKLEAPTLGGDAAP